MYPTGEGHSAKGESRNRCRSSLEIPRSRSSSPSRWKWCLSAAQSRIAPASPEMNRNVRPRSCATRPAGQPDCLDFIQLREKDLAAGALAALARKLLEALGAGDRSPRLLLNSRADVAIAVAAAGVHLTSASARTLDACPGPPTLRRSRSAGTVRQRLLPHPGRRCPRARLRRKPHPLRPRL